MIEKVLEKAKEQLVDRRRFVGKLTAAVATVFAGVLGSSRPAAAYQYACCWLCQQHNPGCWGNCSWSWPCSTTCASGQQDHYNCTEFYYLFPDCTGQCGNELCSQGYYWYSSAC